MHCQSLKTEYIRNTVNPHLKNVTLFAKLSFSQQIIKRQRTLTNTMFSNITHRTQNVTPVLIFLTEIAKKYTVKLKTIFTSVFHEE